MNTFLHDLIDPGANWCPVCGEPRGVCQCDESDFMPEAADDWDEPDDPCHDWMTIWDDGVGQTCQVCVICGEERIFQYDTDGAQS